MKCDAEPDDDDLVIQLLDAKDDGERNMVFAQIVRRHAHHLMHVLRVVFRGRFLLQDAEDLVQEGLLAAATSISQFDERKGSFRRWLRGIVFNKALMEVRAREAAKRGGQATIVSLSVVEGGTAPPEPEVEDDPARRLQEQEAAAALLTAVEKLPPLQRAILRSLMHSPRPDWTDNRAVDEELAKVHNTTLGTIRTERSKALSTLRDALIQGGWKGKS